MLRIIGKFAIYASASCFVSGLALITGSTFIDKFSDSILPLLAAILAINITTSALLSGEIKKFITNTPDTEPLFKDTITEIKCTFKTQIVLICLLFIVLIIKNVNFLQFPLLVKYITFVSNAFIVGVFAYFLEIIYDLGVSLFQIIDSNKK